jgi:molybdate transport repressor ModE-like protein
VITALRHVSIDNLEVKLEIKLMRGNSVIMDGLTADLLRAISSSGSILASAKLLGIPYAKAWRMITSLERRIGGKVIKPRRGGAGGGGAELTEIGVKLMNFFEEMEERFGINKLFRFGGVERADLVVMGSHDLLLEGILGGLRGKGISVEAHWIGSCGGLLSLSLGEADIAGIHLLDSRSMDYNVPFVRELFPMGVALFRGYEREIGWAYRDRFSIDELISGKLRLANRNKGSGTRILIDRILSELGGRASVRGYRSEYFTHSSACEAVARGRADVTMTIRPIAESFSLRFSAIGWERYDFAVKEEILEKEAFSEFLRELTSKKDFSIAGYRFPEDTGARIL